ncbi:multicopper oxidase domain-containing protein [Spirosoma luteum]|uniref:multicopper oxidase domain-containing protein n=1 Tax=Spirosoma luteum TaxID=431553 RepID=UPI00036291DD|nr:multicopper oxidase domain-containing protein [Spirosoma luteum]
MTKNKIFLLTRQQRTKIETSSNLWLHLILICFINGSAFAQNTDNRPVHEYTLTIRKEMVNKTGKSVPGITVNGTSPGPTIQFTEGEYAVIHVKNEMDVETSVHWHGLLVPNFYDGVPYLNIPPIEPGKTQKYEFPLNQSGTYWYHAHTMLQEQSGLFGSIVIEPKEKTLTYDKEQVLIFSDWTDQKPENVMRNLKRGNEWYNIRKGTSTPLNRVIRRGAFGAQLNFWKQRMESAGIADVYYSAFIVNGQKTQDYPDYKPGERVRLRIINGSASSQFWLTFGGEDPLLVAADGLNVVPVVHNKTFIAIAETYDFIVTVPKSGKLEVRASVQDGSGTTSAYLGQGAIVAAPIVPRPDKIAMMQQMAKMNMRMGAPAIKFNLHEVSPQQMMNNWGMQMGKMKGMEMSDKSMDSMDMSDNSMPDKTKKQGNKSMNGMTMSDDSTGKPPMDHSKMDHAKNGSMANMDMSKPADKPMGGMDMSNGKRDKGMSGMAMKGDASGKDMSKSMPGMKMYADYNYDYLKSPEKTTLDPNRPVRNILLNLTGNMRRYIWSMNGVPLAEADNIEIKKGETVRLTLNNLTMMHHPMHLHGHFFRVINKYGDYSPLKNVANVPPMQKITIEFAANEYGSWFFHCHVLYHLVGGMGRVFSYDTAARDDRLKGYPLKKLTREGNGFYNWGVADVASHLAQLNLVSSNYRNQFNVMGVRGWNKRFEAEVSYGRYLYDYLQVFVGVNAENERQSMPNDVVTTAIAGVRYLTPYLFALDVRIDSRLRPQISLSRSIMIFPRTMLFGEYEYQADFGWTKRPLREGVPEVSPYMRSVTWSAGVEYFLSRNVSIMGSYANRFGAGGGMSLRF